MMQTILRDSCFQVDNNGHGGNHRTSQINDLLQSADFKIKDYENISVSKDRWSRYSNGLKFLARNKFKISPNYKLVSACGHQYQTRKKIIEKHQNLKVLLWENTKNYIVPYIAKEQQVKIVAIPQNLESLVPEHLDSFTKEGLPHSLNNEIKSLERCDAVFCISREEQWLLKLFGINADFLPYYPPKSILSNLLNLRELRNINLDKKRFLILGTCFNQPTKIGMTEQIKWLTTIRQHFDFEVDIAGYGTETLAEHCQHANFNLIGSVDSENLNQLLVSAKAILVHQQAGVGALTRIPEMLIAGIPVVANANACRSAFGYSGVHCYDSHDELAVLLKQNLNTPNILPRPQVAEKRFIDRMTELMRSH